MSPITRKALLLMLLLQQARNRKLLNQIDKQEKMPVRKIFIYRKIKGEFRLLIADLKLYDHNYLKSS